VCVRGGGDERERETRDDFDQHIEKVFPSFSSSFPKRTRLFGKQSTIIPRNAETLFMGNEKGRRIRARSLNFSLALP
jgi:hypothetical protein